MALSNLFAWNSNQENQAGTACGASDKINLPLLAAVHAERATNRRNHRQKRRNLPQTEIIRL
ncbi:ACGX-repeat peptide [Megamonas hypermegale]|uniref:ACGX-repeat peptide n=1 Tax=Megamonas hypermegale TaxID=158847 RepID=UPI0026EEB09F|nr:ACGX-repeat peptide [Megamonas hypermegale]